MAAAAEEAIILRRLRARETTLKRVTRRMILLSKSSSPDQCEREYAAFVKELASFEFGLGQLRLANDTVDAQKQETALQQSLLEARLNGTKEELASLKAKLRAARQARANEEQYDSIIRQLNKFPTRHDTQQAIDQMNQEIAVLEQQASSDTAALDLRSKQFQLLLFSLAELKRSLGDSSDHTATTTTSTSATTSTSS